MTRFRILFTAVIAGCALYAGICRGEESATAVQFKLKPSGFASMEFGEIVKGGLNKKTNKNMDNTWMKQIIAGLSVNADLSERSSLIIGLEMQMYNDFPVSIILKPEYRYLYFYPYLSQAEFTHVFGDIDNPYLTLSAGYFPFKYNRDVRNLGEYLFRTGTYPQYIVSSVDFPLARLMGLHAYYTPLKNLKVDAVFYTNLQWYAIGDWNLAAIVSYKVADWADVGLGGSLNSIISADTTLTTPRDPATLYHITTSRDSSFYTFKGAKLMARASIDFKKFIPNHDMMGKEDLRLYGEAAILGLKDYPRNIGDISYDTILKRNIYSGRISYDSILERIPMMIGLNIPAFKFLDVLSVEVEWFKSPYPNDIGAITQLGLPLPGSITENGKTDYRAMSIYSEDRWKWSIYGARTFARNYTVTFQVASDHLRSLAVNDQNVDFEEVLHNTNHWYYMLKAAVKF
jgi:hypothetical protein